jgi:ferric-dicitrate binding protein FerR (iron transport regulator)
MKPTLSLLADRIAGGGVMKRRVCVLAAVAAAAAFAVAPTASAHNRAHIVLPDGSCIIVGSEKSVTLPDGTMLDLDPNVEGDEIGTSYAAYQGNSAIAKGPCP